VKAKVLPDGETERQHLIASTSRSRPLGLETIQVYVGIVALAGFALVVALALTGRFDLSVDGPGGFWQGGLGSIVFVVFVLLGELLPVTVPRSNDTEEITTSTTFAFALILGWGVGWGITALVGASIIADCVRRKQLRKILFNAGQYTLALGCAGLVYTALSGSPSIGMSDLPAILAAGVTFFVINSTLTAVAVGLTQGVRIRDHIRHNIVFNTAVAVVLLSMAPVVVVLAETSPMLVPLLALPLAAVYIGASVALKNSRLEELNRLKDDFVAMVSHELRTPLTSIQGSVKTLLQLGDDLDKDQRTSLLEAVDRQSDRLRRLIERLLVVARLEADAERVSLAPVPLRTLCEYVVFELQPVAGSHTFHVDFDPELIEVETDEGKVHQILSNLVENALKYSRADSRITIQCRRELAAVLLVVEDQGAGIPKDARDRIFDRFYQVDQSEARTVGGTGLGLYICRKLAEAMGAALTLDDAYDGGCRFVLRIPDRTSDASRAPQADLTVRGSSPPANGAGNGRRVTSIPPAAANGVEVVSSGRSVTR